jgi:protein O-GlcNAc transferase
MSAPAAMQDPCCLERARSLRSRGKTAAAVAELRRAVAVAPAWAEAHHQLGNALKSLGEYAEAVAALGQAARLAPGQSAIWLNLGVACLELGRPGESEECFRRALALEPLRAESRNILGHALLLQGRCAEAALELEKALQLRPAYAAAHDNLGRVLKAQGRAAEALAHHSSALQIQPRPATHSNLLFTLNLVPGLEPAAVAAEHRHWASLHSFPGSAEICGREHDFSPQRRLRVGYVSPDFVHHAVTYFFEPVLDGHDSTQFETICYSDAPLADKMTKRLRRQAGRWRDSSRLSDSQLEDQIRRDKIDILVDLAGHTAGNRLTVFSRRPAPVQVTWLGYPNTTGLDQIDYRLTETVCDPPGQTEAWHSEKLFRLPGPFSCYRPPAESPAVGPLPGMSAGMVTFGCFNNIAKMHSGTFRRWARILRGAPGSRLLLKSRGLSDPATVEAMREQFDGLGVAGSRIEFDGEDLSVQRHLALYHRVDIALDTDPYNGTTTTCEALWMGVPVVTLAGRTHASRVGASLLGHLGLLEGIASSEDDYVSMAWAYASDLPRLAALRRGLRQSMRKSPLCDETGFVRDLEAGFRRMWTERCARA